jgi:hypothetical protein
MKGGNRKRKMAKERKRHKERYKKEGKDETK